MRWYDDRRQQRTKSFATKRQAEAFRSSVEHELRTGTYVDRALGGVAFSEVAREWLLTRVDVTPSSRHTYRSALERHALPRWGEVRLDRITRKALAEWFTELGYRLSPRSVIAVHRVTSMVLKWAVETDRLVRNPAERLPLPRPVRSKHVYLTHADVEALACAAGRSRVLILTLAYTGLRFGEVAALTVGSVDLDGRRLRVTQAWAGQNTGTPYLAEPKTHERRKVGLPPFLVEELRVLVTGREPGAWLFTSPYGSALNLPNWRRREFDTAVRRAGLEVRGLTPHSLRHTAASLAIAAGADVKVVQTMLGHKDAAMTLNTYAGLFPDRLDEVADRMERAREIALEAASPSLRPSL